MKEKLRIGVLMGGKSIEKEISFNSGRTICDHIDTIRYEIIPLFQTPTGKLFILPWHFLHRGKISDFEERLESEAKIIVWDDLKTIIDFMYIVGHGRYTEDGAVQGFLETLQIPYLGSKVLASAIGMDKIFQKKILASQNIVVPKYLAIYPDYIISEDFSLEAITKNLFDNGITFPCIVKPHKEGSSLGVTIVDCKENLHTAILKAAFINEIHPQAIIIEELIEGMEFTCIVIADTKTKQLIPLPPTEIVPENHKNIFCYDQKYMPGRALKYTPARVSKEMLEEIQKVSIQVTEILDFNTISRIDGFLTKDNKVIITDPNSLCGMAPSAFVFQQAAMLNMSHTDLINHLIESELIRYNMLSNENKDINLQITRKTQKIRIAVLFGGKSNEKEISLESGRNVIYKLSPHKYEPLPIFVDENLELYRINQHLLVQNTTYEISQSISKDMKIKWSDLPNLADFAFIALHGGEGENGSVQGALEILSLPYNGSSILTSALCMNKFKTNEFLKSQYFNVPKNLLINKIAYKNNKEEIINQVETLLTYPVIAKPHDDGCSIMVKKVNNKKELIYAIENILNTKNKVLIEQFIIGMELTVGVVGNKQIKVLPPTEVITSNDILSIEEKFLPGKGENKTPAAINQNAIQFITDTISKIYKNLDCKGYARIDCFYQNKNVSNTGKDELIIIEVNTLPALTPATCIFHQAAESGLKPMDFIDLIIELGFEEHKPKFNLEKQIFSISNDLYLQQQSTSI